MTRRHRNRYESVESGGRVFPNENIIQKFIRKSVPRHCRLTIVHFTFLSPSLLLRSDRRERAAT